MENFNWKNYIERYPDLQEAGINTRKKAIRHYNNFGKNENRTDYNRYSLNITRTSNPVFRTSTIPTSSTLTLNKVKLPTSVDLRSKFPPCYDQGNLGSCTANAIIGAYQYLTPSFMGSRLFLYYNERVIEKSVKCDCGAYIRNGIKAIKNSGLCIETDWPYTIKRFAVKPIASCYKSALKHKAINVYNVVQTLEAMKGYLVAGFPFIVGIVCYNSFESTSAMATGLIPLPTSKDTVLGGHCVICIGYNDTITCPGSPAGSWLMRNSWSTNIYGSLKGNFWIPYAYLTNTKLTSDCWEITTGSG